MVARHTCMFLAFSNQKCRLESTSKENQFQWETGTRPKVVVCIVSWVIISQFRSTRPSKPTLLAYSTVSPSYFDTLLLTREYRVHFNLKSQFTARMLKLISLSGDVDSLVEGKLLQKLHTSSLIKYFCREHTTLKIKYGTRRTSLYTRSEKEKRPRHSLGATATTTLYSNFGWLVTTNRSVCLRPPPKFWTFWLEWYHTHDWNAWLNDYYYYDNWH